MRQFFYKSGLVITILILISILFTLCGTAFARQHRLYKVIPGMTSEYVIFYTLDEEKMNLETCAELLNKLEVYSVKGIKFQDGCAVDFHTEKQSGITLKKGRFFNDNDYTNRTDVVMIREDMEDLCRIKNGKKMFQIQNKDYQVIGIYSKGDSNDERSNKYLVNLYAKSLCDLQYFSYGFYDAGSSSLSHFEKSELAQNKIEYIKATDEREELNRGVLSSVKAAITLYSAVGIILVINIFSAIYIWLSGKKKEIVLRKMVGAKHYQIYWNIIKKFMLLVIGTFIVGTLAADLLLHSLARWEFSPSMIVMFGTQIEWQGVFLSFAVVIVIGFIVINIVLKRYLKKEMIQLIHAE